MRPYRLTWVRRLLNLLSTLAVRVGLPPGHRYLLTVPGRRTGRTYTTPVGLVETDAGRWLVAPYGEVGWVRNARASRTVRLERAGRRERLRLADVDTGDAGPVLKMYLKLEPITRPFFLARPDDPASAFAAESADHPVFKLLPADIRGGPA